MPSVAFRETVRAWERAAIGRYGCMPDPTAAFVFLLGLLAAASAALSPAPPAAVRTASLRAGRR
jgi:hypothetical protein